MKHVKSDTAILAADPMQCKPLHTKEHATVPHMRSMAVPHIIRIPILPFGMVNCHVIKGPSGCVLVDAGLPGSEAKIGRALRKHGLSFEDIQLIVITHAHVDHAGAAAALRAATGALVLAHEADAKYYRREVPMSFCSTGWAGDYLLKRGIILRPYIGFEPDILLSNNDTFDLSPYGISGLVLPTVGHTAGSISVRLSTQEALVGDLVASGIFMGGIFRTGNAIRPPFEDDPHAVGIELQRLVDSGVRRFHMGHGGPLEAREVQRHAQQLMKMRPAGSTAA